MTLLHRAAAAGDNVERVRRVILLGVSVSPQTPVGWTPLHFAAANGYGRVADVLLEAGADPRATTGEGLTARDLAARNHHDELAEQLGRVAL